MVRVLTNIFWNVALIRFDNNDWINYTTQLPTTQIRGGTNNESTLPAGRAASLERGCGSGN